MIRLLAHIADVASGRARPLHPRSPHWGALERAFIEQHPHCEACGGTEKLAVHHVFPFHLRPELEMDTQNLITLCTSGKSGANCHLHYGHNGDWKSFNPNVRRDAAQAFLRLMEAA